MATNNDATTPATSGEIRIDWLNFIEALKSLLVPQQDDRPLDQYLQFRDAVIALVTSENFLAELHNVWSNHNDNNKLLDHKVKELLLLELRAFAPAVAVADLASNPPEKKSWWRSLLGKAGTTVGSVKDLIPDIPLLKGGLTVLNELIDIFKG